MSKKIISHGVFKIPEHEKDLWACGFGNCNRKAICITVRQYIDGTERHSGGCESCTKRWQKDCTTCLKKIEELSKL